ncbi:hypothetical protein [Halogranum amylolyticum]|uniref:hypothetical protein n=1 Tax=Halogranum amylolyticum TaxID=660520 RepID=UPI001114808D|nr:hypothetical protein [Halogranum amylolyticum]
MTQKMTDELQDQLTNRELNYIKDRINDDDDRTRINKSRAKTPKEQAIGCVGLGLISISIPLIVDYVIPSAGHPLMGAVFWLGVVCLVLGFIGFARLGAKSVFGRVQSQF